MKTCIIIAGPTAVGKTSIAIDVAEHFNTSIISADSRQCYKELNIGVARPSKAQLARVPHFFIASHSVNEDVNARTFEKYALDVAEELFKTKETIVMVGGTGLYIKAFSDGLDKIPEVPAEIHSSVIASYQDQGIMWLQQQLKKSDPLYAAKGEMLNPVRMMRALEVFLATGKSIIEFQTSKKTDRGFRIIKIGLKLEKAVLHQHIHHRVNQMIHDDLLDEVQSLLPVRHLKALQTVGYSEMFEVIDGFSTLDLAIEKLKTNTRRYAKRQMTWFNKDQEMHWIDATSGISPIIDIVTKETIRQ